MPLAGSGTDEVANRVVEFSETMRVKLVGADGAVHIFIFLIEEYDTVSVNL